MKRIAAGIILLLWTLTADAQFLRTSGTSIVDESGREVVLRGIGLGGWMLQEPYMMQLGGVAMAQHEIRSKISALAGEEATEKFYQAWLDNHCTKADIDSLAAWGFNSVRLPMHYNLFTLPIEQEPVPGKDTWLDKGFVMTDSLLAWCSRNRIYLILDLHAAPGGQGNDNAIADRDTTRPSLWQDKENQRKTIALWRRLAERYRDEPWLGAYDIINEPNWGFENPADKNGCAEKSNEPLKILMTEITAAIRQADKKHIIIIEGNCWGNNYSGILPPWDDNMVLSFHKYWNNTDQASIQQFLDLRQRWNMPVWMGESGENSNSWFTSTIALLEQHRIGWAWWPLKKLGINNPLQVNTNAGWTRVIEYWKGNAEKPTDEEARSALMQLAADLHISKNIIRRDVIDAMFRQVGSTATIPFGSTGGGENMIVFAADYDLGRIGSAYHDKDSGNYWVSTGKRTEWNKGWRYRNDGVDIIPCEDTISNGHAVSWIEAGEWLQYTLYSEEGGSHQLSFRYRAKETGGEITPEVNGLGLPAIKISHVDGNSWRTLPATEVMLRKGENRIRLFFPAGGFDLNYFKLQSKSKVQNNLQSR